MELISFCGPRAPAWSLPRARTDSQMGNTPKAKPQKAPGVNGFKYKEQFGVIVICRDEAEHKAVYEQLKALGYKCKVVRV